MTRLLAAITPAAAIALLASTAGAQLAEPRSSPPFDTVAERGKRDGRAAAGAASVGYYAVLGLLTGFVTGAATPIVWFESGPAAGAATLVPLGLTIAAAGRTTGAAPPSDLAAHITLEPATYQAGFRAAYAQHLAQRRRRAAIIGGAVGTVVGLVAFVASGVAGLVTAAT